MIRLRSQTGGVMLLAWVPVVIGAWLLLRRGVMRKEQGLRRPRSVRKLCQAIVGQSKNTIAEVFGLPRASAGFSSIAPAMVVASDYQKAEVWYYPLDHIAKVVLAVSFEQDIAKAAQIVPLPEKIPACKS